MALETLRFEEGPPARLHLLDQTRLPNMERMLAIESVDALASAIQRLAVRGAPALGVAAAYGVVLGVVGSRILIPEDVEARAREAAATLAKSRPTAKNLFWALDRVVAAAARARRLGAGAEAIVQAILREARAIHAEDVAACRRMGELGAAYLQDGSSVLTHCNAGALATSGIGSALAPLYVARERGLALTVFADETRPLLQGARLTAYELARAGLDVTVIADSAAASLMHAGRIDLVFVGADRIARNGDVANKIGTYALAVLAREHGIPFHVVAPLSTFDLELEEGSQIPIEERAPDELLLWQGTATAPPGVRAWNPAFDVTPARWISSIVTEAGIVERPDRSRIDELLRRSDRIV